VVGFASGRIPSIQMNRVLLKDISIDGVHWGPYVREHPAYFGQAQQALAGMYRAGHVRPVIGKRYRLEDAPLGLRDLADRKITGKAVLSRA
jgi:NADPH2:quinone reductase